jgi:WD40 repeat protein
MVKLVIWSTGIKLRDSVFDSVAFETCALLNDEVLLVNRSVTEWETLFGLDCDKEHCFWIHRSFDKEQLKAFKTDPNYNTLTDGEMDVLPERSTTLKLDNLKAKMKSVLRADQYSELSKQISPADYFDERRCVEYLHEWERLTRDCLEKELEKVVLKSVEWNKGFAGIPADHLEEIIHHCSTAFTKASSFIGREELVEQAMDVIKNGRTKGNENSMFSGIDLGLVGKSGCGKTAFMSKLFLSSSSMDSTIPTVVRFCGTSKFSVNGLKLIQSIAIQILTVYEKKDELEKLLITLPSQDYKTAVEIFQALIAEYPVNLFIDSLDQLENRYEERSKLTFLRDLKPNEHSKIIVSTLPDEYNEDGNPGQYFYRCEKTLKSGNVHLVYIGNMDSIETTMRELLLRRRRKLTKDQWIVTLSEVTHEPTILYINLALEVVSQWRSFEKEVLLKPTMKRIIHQILDGIEKNFGSEFTAIAFAMITFSREGVNDQEMRDLLSLHDGAMKEVCQYSTLHCFPMHAWLRLKFVVKNLVTEKENHCIRWYHRQLWETASERYSEKKKECHELMGRYFTNSFDGAVMKERDIMEQPLVLNGVSIWLSECLVNRRRVIEGYYHLTEAGFLDEAVEEICSLEFVCASKVCGEMFSLLRCISRCLSIYNGNEEKKRKLDHYLRWIRKRANSIASNPSWIIRSTAGEEPSESEVRRSALTLFLYHSNNWNECSIITSARFRMFDNLEMDLFGHSSRISSVSWNYDGTKIVSGSWDKTLKIWDTCIGELLHTLEGHSNWVTSVSWNHDGSKIVSGSFDETIKIWDASSGELLTTLEGHSNGILSVSWNHEGSKIVSGSWDKTIKIWDADNGALLNTLEGHSREVTSVSWNPDGTKIVSGSVDSTIKIWNAGNGELLNTFEGHSSEVTSVAWNCCGTKVVSGSRDKTVKIWNADCGELLKTLEGYATVVHSVSWNHDGSKIVSGSGDKMIKIWDADSGELLNTLEGYSDVVYSVSWSHDGSKIVSGSYDATIKIWEASNREVLNSPKHHSDTVNSVSWNRDDSQIVSGSADGPIRIWNSLNGELLKTLEGHSNEVTSVSWNHGSIKLVSGSWDRTIKIWNSVNGQLLTSLEGHSGSVTSVSWDHDDSKIVSGSSDKTIKIWDADYRKILNTLEGHATVVSSVAWNHDGSKIVSGSYDRTVKIWHAGNGGLLTTLEGHSNGVSSVSWNYDGTIIVSGSYDRTIKLWNAGLGELLNTLEGHSNGVSSVCWNHDGSKIISGSRDKTLKIWDAVTGDLLNTLEGHSGEVTSVSWNHDGTKLVSGSDDKTFKIWSA